MRSLCVFAPGLRMRSCIRPLGLCAILSTFYASQASAQSPGAPSSASSVTLQQEYDQAQALQRAGKLNEAADGYRSFIAKATGELAIGYAVVPDYPQSEKLFNEALQITPADPALLLDYARTALASGDPARARSLAGTLIEQHPPDHRLLADAHQLLGRALLKLNLDRDARKELEAALALDPTFANGYDLAIACLDLNDENCASQIFSEMQASFGDTAEIHLAFGRAYGDSDFQPRAIMELRKAIQENPRIPGAHYLLAALLLATGNDQTPLESAEAELKQELQVSPNDAQTYAALGKLAVTRKDYSAAEEYLNKAISIAPINPDAYLYSGQMYFETNRLDKAEQTLRRCIQLTTDASRNRFQVQQAHYLLGRILMKQGKSEAAHAEMAISRELADKTLSQDKSKLAGLMDSPDLNRDHSGHVPPQAAPGSVSKDTAALSRVEEARRRFKDPLADSYNNLGAIAATNADFANAVRYFNNAASWNPQLDGLDYNWGRAAFAGSLFADAVAPLTRYSKSHPDDTGAFSALGFSEFMTGDYRGCVETLRRVAGKSELAPQVEYGYAESLVRTGNVDAGLERLNALERSHPEIPDVHRAMGEALEIQRDHTRALDELQKAVQLAPRDADARYDLGKTELEAGNTTRAVTDLELAVKLSPANQTFHEELAKAYTAALRPADAQKEMAAYKALKAAER